MSKNNLISVHFATFYLQIETTMVAIKFQVSIARNSLIVECL